MNQITTPKHHIPNANLAEFIIQIEAHNANVNIPVIRKAYEWAEKAHAGQVRESGVPYIDHCREVALILAEWHMDSDSIAAGLLHDSVEDTEITIDDLRREFNDEIADLVDGVTKIGAIKYKSREEQQVDYFRKMLLSMAKDIRVILIKLADRVHNMRTLEHVPRDKQTRIAQETRDIYAPLANRFGIAKAKTALEDLSLKYLEPERYQELANRVAETREEREKYIDAVVKPIRAALQKEGIKAEISGRAKHLDSINRKIRVRGVPFEQIFDFSAVRVIVGQLHECYHVLGVIHSMYKPTPERFHDYIANPKPNGYQSLHTTVIGPHGKPVEIQIRTRGMHHVAENGIAAHWLYKEGKKTFDKSDKQMAWLRDVLDWQKDMKNPTEFMEYLKGDLFPHDIYVFTPAGMLIHLPAKSTPLDFAFQVHTEVGLHCVGAKINDRIAQISTPLKSGDVVEIITNPQRTPSRDWLKIVVTSNARSRIRRWLKKSGHDRLIALGKDMLERELKKAHLEYPSDDKLEDIAHSMSLKSGESLLVGIGNGDYSSKQVATRLLPPEERIPESTPATPPETRPDTSDAIKIQGEDDLLYRLAGCCQPIPGDEIVGYVTRGRGVTVHRTDCVNIANLHDDNDRRIEATWDVSSSRKFPVDFEIQVVDRKNILRDITQEVSDSDTYLRSARITASGDTALGKFSVDVSSLAELDRLFTKIRRVQGVISVRRSGRTPRDSDTH